MSIDTPHNIGKNLLSQAGQPAGALVTPETVRLVVASLAGIASSQQTESYTAALVDAGTVVEMNSSSGLTFTVPPSSSVGFDVGAVIEICQMGTGQITLAAGEGVTLVTPSSLTTRAQYSTVSIRQRAINYWVCAGDLT